MTFSERTATALGHDRPCSSPAAHYAIQLAKLRRARVLTTVNNPEKAARLAPPERMLSLTIARRISASG
jgi:hypothetical protein